MISRLKNIASLNGLILFVVFGISFKSLPQPKVYEIYPLLPRVDYNGVYFFNPDTGFAVGENGTVIKTTDGGDSWQQKETPTSLTLAKIQSFSENNIFVCGLYGTLLHSTDEGENWDSVNLGIESTLLAIKIVNEQTGWFCGRDSVLFKTEDSGKTWTRKYTGFLGNYRDIDFYDERIGYICSTSGFLVTEDSGKTWVSKIYGGFNTVEPINDSVVLAGSPTGHIYYSENKGTTWTTNMEPIPSNIQSLEMINDTLGFASATDAGGYYFTTDGGKTWDTEYERIGNRQIIFVDDSIGYGVGAELTLTKTTNKGKYWKRLIINEGINAICFINENEGFLAAEMIYSFEESKLYFTSDKGYSWEINDDIQSQSIEKIYNIYFIDSLNGFIGARNSKIYKTINGGKNWEIRDTTLVIIGIEWVPVKNFNFVDNYGWALISGYSGTKIKKTTDLGETWNLLGHEFDIRINNIFFLDTLTGWAAGNSYFAKTTDGGISWIKDTLLNYSSYIDIFFSDSINGWLTIDSNRTLETTNGGISWHLTELCGGNFIIVDDSVYYLTSNTGLYYTSDEGKNWNLRLDSANALALSTIPKAGIGWGVDYDLEKIFKYEDDLTVAVEETNIKKNNSSISLKVYPLPSNSQTNIVYTIIESGTVSMELYNLLGERIDILFKGYKTPGEYNISYNSSIIASGIYFIKLDFDSGDSKRTLTQKLLFLK